jgi:hypothetical protein
MGLAPDHARMAAVVKEAHDRGITARFWVSSEYANDLALTHIRVGTASWTTTSHVRLVHQA